MTQIKNPFADPDALVDYGLRGRDIVVVNTPIPPRVPRPTRIPTGQGSQPVQGRYIIMDKTSTYALGVHALRDACVAENNGVHPKYRVGGQELYRPFTFKEGIVARLTEFNTLKNPDGSDRSLDERVKLMLRWNDSCTGIAYQAKSTKFRIIPVCEPLITIERDYHNGFLAVPYVSLGGVELDSSIGIYNTIMTKQQIEDHQGWRAVVEGDVALLKEYRDIVFATLQQRDANNQMPEKAMGFYVRQNTGSDELRALLVVNLDDDSGADGSDYLYSSGSFVRLAPSQKISQQKI